jgi:hypothetical protein
MEHETWDMAGNSDGGKLVEKQGGIVFGKHQNERTMLKHAG